MDSYLRRHKKARASCREIAIWAVFAKQSEPRPGDIVSQCAGSAQLANPSERKPAAGHIHYTHRHTLKQGFS